MADTKELGREYLAAKKRYQPVYERLVQMERAEVLLRADVIAARRAYFAAGGTAEEFQQLTDEEG